MATASSLGQLSPEFVAVTKGNGSCARKGRGHGSLMAYNPDPKWFSAGQICTDCDAMWGIANKRVASGLYTTSSRRKGLASKRRVTDRIAVPPS